MFQTTNQITTIHLNLNKRVGVECPILTIISADISPHVTVLPSLSLVNQAWRAGKQQHLDDAASYYLHLLRRLQPALLDDVPISPSYKPPKNVRATASLRALPLCLDLCDLVVPAWHGRDMAATEGYMATR